MSNVRPDPKTFVVILLSLLLILTLYDALFYALWKRQILLPEQVVTLFADFVFTPAVAAPSKLGPVSEHELDLRRLAPPNQMPFNPVAFSSELSAFCHELYAPIYPSDSRRLGEEGKVLIQVELDTDGQVDKAEVVNSSGYARLDNAAVAAVKNWRCEPTMRDGHSVRAIALQPFNFVLQ